jgi:GNAT superfamily N-acetyltransferase
VAKRTAPPGRSEARPERTALALRVASPTDVEAIVGLVESAYRGDASRAGWTTEADLLCGQRTDASVVHALLATAACEILLAERDRELVGCCQVERQASHTAYFGMFAVRPDLQGRGIGRWLIGEAERLARAWGSSTLRMTVLQQRVELLAWYSRLGYRPTGGRVAFPYGDERFGIPRRDDLEFLVLEKDLRRHAGDAE